MDPFLLSINHLDTGLSHFTYDIGPADRANVLVWTARSSEVLDIPAENLLGYTLSTERTRQPRRSTQ